MTKGCAAAVRASQGAGYQERRRGETFLGEIQKSNAMTFDS
jgi:hypothetical protein